MKRLKKEDWQIIAKDHSVEYTQQNTVRYLVEKVAEKIGVDDKIVDTEVLKEKVLEKIEEIKKSKETKKTENNTKPTPEEGKKKETKKTSSKAKPKSKSKPKAKKNTKATDEQLKEHYEAEAKRLGVNYNPKQTWRDIEKLIELYCKQNNTSYMKYGEKKETSPGSNDSKGSENEKGDNSKLEELRKKCTDVGLAYTEKHDEKDLEQLLSAFQSSGGAQAPMPQGVNTPSQPPVAEEQPPMIGQNLPNGIKEQEPVKEIVKANEKDLKHYADVFLHTINGHFRAMTVIEIQELFSRSKYPFSHSIKRNKENHNQVEIILTSDNHERRIPQDKNKWIEVGG